MSISGSNMCPEIQTQISQCLLRCLVGVSKLIQSKQNSSQRPSNLQRPISANGVHIAPIFKSKPQESSLIPLFHTLWDSSAGHTHSFMNPKSNPPPGPASPRGPAWDPSISSCADSRQAMGAAAPGAGQVVKDKQGQGTSPPATTLRTRATEMVITCPKSQDSK